MQADAIYAYKLWCSTVACAAYFVKNMYMSNFCLSKIITNKAT